MKKIIIFSMAALLPFGAYTQGCEKPRNAFDQVYCLSAQFSQVDRDLNQQYSRLRQQLKAPQQAMLRNGQLAWIRQRDAQCSERRRSNRNYLIDLQCAVDMTQQRIAFLQKRERECSSTGCVNARLGD